MSELDVNHLLGVTEAIAIIDGVAVQPRVVTLPLADAAGLVLAEELKADRDFPPFDKALMDGFAVRSADLATVPARLKVIETIAAGSVGTGSVEAWQAVAIMTGAPIPAGADAVVPVEHTSTPGEGRVVIHRGAKVGAAIARRASDMRAGETVLPAGTRIGAAQIAVAASVGAASVRVFAKPRVAVMSTGDEIVPIDQTPGPSQIRNSNSPMLHALLERLGCEVTDLGQVRDEPETLRAAISNGLQYDALFVTGGMSMGQFDYVPRLLRELEVDLKITKLRIKPGKPFVFGQRTKDLGLRTKSEPEGLNPKSLVLSPPFVFGLPGNPVSAFVCTLRFASRLISRLGGGAVRERWIPATLSVPLPANGPREFYQPAIIADGVAIPMNWKGSADIFGLARADALLVRGENEAALPVGSAVRLLEIPS